MMCKLPARIRDIEKPSRGRREEKKTVALSAVRRKRQVRERKEREKRHQESGQTNRRGNKSRRDVWGRSPKVDVVPP